MIGADRLVYQLLQGIKADVTEDLSAKNISKGDLGMVPILKISGDMIYGEIQANHYWYYLVHGRKPGKQPPIDSILEWLEKKGITADISLRSLAFLVARKIGRVGTDIYLGKRPALALDAIIAKRQEEFEAEFLPMMQKDIQEMIFAKFKLSN